MRYLPALFFLTILFSCKKDTPETAPAFEAYYRVQVTMQWEAPQFSIPENAHVTPLIGMIHSKDTFLWNTGRLATTGLENVAEVGDDVIMNTEGDAMITSQKAFYKFTIPPPLIMGTEDTVFLFNTDFSYISFASMLAPSPDWFMGIHDINLLQNGKWVDDITLDILVYDAGTEEGDIFGYDNPESSPREFIQLLTTAKGSVLANGNTMISPIGTIRFIKN